MKKKMQYGFLVVAAALTLQLFCMYTAVMAAEYPGLSGVKQLRVVFDVSVSSPQGAVNVFWAVRNLYQAENVIEMSVRPQVAVVFRGPAVRLISQDRSAFIDDDRRLLEEFAETIRQMKTEAVTFEVCRYAMQKAGVDAATVFTEIDQVDNGFISIAGYQAQGYAVITIQ